MSRDRQPVDEALQALDSSRVGRKAAREAVHASMEELGLIQRTRGGR